MSISVPPRFSFVAIDLEIHPGEDRILQIGAVTADGTRTFARRGGGVLERALAELDAFCEGADFLLGHNLACHDIPYLRRRHPDLRLLQSPLLDTLFLSPLAFPQNPYHRLVKDYKIIRESANDPVGDAACTASLFADQVEAFGRMTPRTLGLFGGLLDRTFPADFYARFFAALRGAPPLEETALKGAWMEIAAGRVCLRRSEAVFEQLFRDPQTAAALAYIAAWLGVAGGNSVVPPWVRRRFPVIPMHLDELRASACGDPGCAYCAEHHHAGKALQRFFGFERFLPVRGEDPPLQQQVVERILAGRSCLTVMPTGSGKSLCFQLPALMRARQRSQLTLILSPLQSLMKDQVDSLRRRGIANVGAVNGLLTMLERARTLEGIRLGDIDLVWIAPEQMRNTTVKATLKQREIGLVVIDEAHCLSKWGHDFRPDYLFIVKFLRELQPEGAADLPQIVCFTATAKKDVIEEICGYFREEGGLELEVFEGGHERPNLRFSVEAASENEKIEMVDQLLREIFQASGPRDGCIVFTATRSAAERVAEGLRERSWLADYFHGGRSPEDKRSVQERFLEGELQVIAATNAFGMGVDKPEVRAVIHYSVPGSLENYLQEAGRAGRDKKPAVCCLLFTPEDLETQFWLSAQSWLEWRDISGLLTGLKHLAERHPERTIVVTAGELLGSEAVEEQGLENLTLEDPSYDIRTRTALAWLERQGKLERGDNRTSVIQGQVLVRSLAEAEGRMAALGLSENRKAAWLALLQVLLESDPKELLNTDRLSQATGLEPRSLVATLRSMREAGLLNHDLNLTAYVHVGVVNDSRRRLEGFLHLEKALLSLMEEEEPDIGGDTPYILGVRRSSQALKERGIEEARPDRLMRVLDVLIQDKLLRRWQISQDTCGLAFKTDWETLRKQVAERGAVCGVILEALIRKLPTNARGKDLLAAFRSGELIAALKSNLTTSYLKDLNQHMEHGLLALHAIQAIALQSGLTVFRPALTIRVLAGKEDRFYKEELLPLEDHYKERIAQIHIMDRYVALALDSVKEAGRFVADYFNLLREPFKQLYFKGQYKQLEIPTTPESWRRIVADLQNPVQEKAVAAAKGRNILVVAGPGSGKTRLIVHRIAYLVRIHRIQPQRILALAFNRNAVTQLKLRLRELLGPEGAWVRVRTYHSLAMFLTGRIFDPGPVQGTEDPETGYFKDVLQEAVQMLEAAARDDSGLRPWRDTFLPGLRHILVDEYQDINELEYRLVSLLAGRQESDADRRPVLTAVGDDDQNIYSWQGSNVRFIRRFQEDYGAETLELSRNYRSSPAIVAAANALIACNRDRIKSAPIVCAENGPNRAVPHRVGLVGAPDHLSCLKGAILEAQRLLSEDPELAPGDVSILCRTNRELDTLLMLARRLGLPVRGLRGRRLPLTAVREFRLFLDTLNDCRNEVMSAAALRGLVEELASESGYTPQNMWIGMFRSILENHLHETMGRDLPVADFIDYVYDASRDVRQLYQTDRGSVLAATLHTAKGLEFPAVIIAGQPVRNKAGHEEERRLFYVAVTRAMRHLTVFYERRDPHPFIPELAGAGPEAVVYREADPPLDAEDQRDYHTRLWDLDLRDVVISFPSLPGFIKQAQPILRRIEPGAAEALTLVKPGRYYLISYDLTPIARLSARGEARYEGILAQGLRLRRLRFLAAVARREKDAPRIPIPGARSAPWYTGLFQLAFEPARPTAPCSDGNE